MNTQTLSEIAYSPLKDEAPSIEGWDKATVTYAVSHKKWVEATIRTACKSHTFGRRTLGKAEVEDIYSEVLNYLYRAKDYDLNCAQSQTDEGTFISLRSYVGKLIQAVTKRMLKIDKDNEDNLVRDVANEDSDELCIIDTCPDLDSVREMESSDLTLREICEGYEYLRYKNQADLFSVWYIRLKTQAAGKADKFSDILEAVGISKRHMDQLSKSQGNLMRAMALAVTNIEMEEAIAILREYTFAAKILDNAIELV